MPAQGLGSAIAVVAFGLSWLAAAQDMPRTAGESLSGKKIVLADQVPGHSVVLVAGFSHEGGNRTSAWVKAIHADTALNGVSVYTIAQIGGAPGFIRGMIKSSMKKGVPPAEQDYFVVLTEDDKLWRKYFGVTDDQVPYVMLIGSAGNVLWLGHGAPADLEPQLRAALH